MAKRVEHCEKGIFYWLKFVDVVISFSRELIDKRNWRKSCAVYERFVADRLQKKFVNWKVFQIERNIG